jgi:hypothetical protein
MRAMVSSRNMTISWPKNLILHGLLPKYTRGSFERRRAVTLDSNGRRGSIELAARSTGPGTKTKCVVRVMSGYDAMRSANESNPSAQNQFLMTDDDKVCFTNLDIAVHRDYYPVQCHGS